MRLLWALRRVPRSHRLLHTEYAGRSLGLRTDHDDVARFAQAYLQAFGCRWTESGPYEDLPETIVECLAEGPYHYRVRSPGLDAVHDALDCMAVVDMALRQWLVAALTQRTDLRPYHAAAIAIGGRVWAIGGPSESGKSTLAMACHGYGWAVLSDEYTLCQATTAGATVEPFPRPWDIRHSDLDPLVVRGAAACIALGYPVRWPDGRVVPSTYWIPRDGFCLRADLPFGGWVLLDRHNSGLEPVGEESIVPSGLRYPVFRLGRTRVELMVRELESLIQD